MNFCILNSLTLPNQNGTVKMTQILQKQYVTEDFPVLPDRMQRSAVNDLLLKVAPTIGLNHTQLFVLQVMINTTRPSDWIDTTSEPVCFARQKTIAQICGITDRSVRRIERQLEEDFGFLTKSTGMDGRRCRYQQADGSEFTQGLVFSPLVAKIPELLCLAEKIQQESAGRAIIERKISAAKRYIKKMLNILDSQICDDLEAYKETYKSWPSRYPASFSFETLQQHLSEVLDVVEALTVFDQTQGQAKNHLENLKTNLEFFNNETPESGEADSEVPRYIQDTNQEIIVTCNDNEISDPEPPKPALEASDACLEKSQAAKEARQNRFLNDLTPVKLARLCSASMQENIKLYQGSAPYPSVLNFTFAAQDQAHALGITQQAYRQAIEQMGDFATALCILIIDRNINHPVTPIKSPGGVLRAMTARHAKGQLYIERSLMALSLRK